LKKLSTAQSNSPQDENKRLKDELTAMKQALDIQAMTLASYKQEYDALMSQTDDLERSRVQRVAVVSDKDEEIKRLNIEIEGFMKQYSVRLEEIDALRVEINKLKSENNSLIEFINTEHKKK